MKFRSLGFGLYQLKEVPVTMEMTVQSLKAICKEHKLYNTPSLNDKLYANFKGFKAISNLEAYTGLRALFVEGNALESLQGLTNNIELRCM